MGDKRRYVRRDPGNARDKIHSIAEDETGNAAEDGYTVLYRKPLRGVDAPDYRADSLYRENYACKDLMDEDEARYSRSIPGDY